MSRAVPIRDIAAIVSPRKSAPSTIATAGRKLIALRLLQGAAAGGLMTLAMAAVGDLVSPRDRGR